MTGEAWSWHWLLAPRPFGLEHGLSVLKRVGRHRYIRSFVVESESADTIRTTIYTGRPLRACKNEYNVDYETSKRDRIEELQSKGIIVYAHDVRTARAEGKDFDLAGTYPQYMGQAIGGIREVKPAAAIVEEIHD